MIAGTIWNQLVTTLNGSGLLSGYIKYVYEGRRFDIDEKSLPCIMLEPTQNGEGEREMNNIDYQYFNLDIYAFSSNNLNDFKKTIVGGADYKGILDIENDIRGCLKDSYNLGGTVTDVRIDPTQFDSLEIGKYPVRGMVIPIRILYRQQDGV